MDSSYSTDTPSPGRRNTKSFDEYIADLRTQMGTVRHNSWSEEMFGPKFPGAREPFNTSMSRDAIRKFADGIGSLNPIYQDRHYAATAQHKGLIAPGLILYSVAYGHYEIPPGYPPLPFGQLYGGDEFEWFDVIREGDEIDWTTTKPLDIQIKRSRAHGDVAFVYGQHEFRRRSDGGPLANCLFWKIIHDDGGIHRPPRADRVVHSEEYIRQVYAAQDAEEIRGALPRYWEDVTVGETPKPVVRGPHTIMESVAWIIGAIGERYFISDRLHRIMHDHNGWGDWDPDLKIYTNFHELSLTPRLNGIGGQRSAWVEMMLSNWAGDAGFIRRLRTEQRARGGYGNVYWCTAKVTKKYRDGADFCVDLDCFVHDHTDKLLVRGEATILLPSREEGEVLLPRQASAKTGP